jgi:ribonuclease HI
VCSSDLRCSNNQAEQIAIVKALQAIETIKINNNIPRTITIYTDSRIILEALKYKKNRKHLKHDSTWAPPKCN